MKSSPGFFAATAFVAAALTVSLWARAVFAADSNWTNTTGGLFNTPGNWSAGVPGTVDDATFAIPNTYTVDFSAGATNARAAVPNGNVTLNLGGFTYTLTNGSAGLELGTAAGQTGRLTLLNGILAADTSGDNLLVGSVASSSGFLTVGSSGQIGTAATRPDVVAGSAGTGTLTVQNNGKVFASLFRVGNMPGGTGTATITGPQASLDASSITVGNSATGTMTLSAGAELTVAASTTIASGAGSAGTVNVIDAGTHWSGGSMTVGSGGFGTLNVQAGGSLSAPFATVGDLLGGYGVATINGAGSVWAPTAMIVGNAGSEGVLNITGGGRVGVGSTQGITIAAGSSLSQGSATVSGVGSSLGVSGPLIVGENGTGSLTVSDGGLVTSGEVRIGATSATGIGTVTITGAGSSLATFDSVSVGSGNSGTLTVRNGGNLTVADSLLIHDPAGAPIGRLNLDGGSIFTTHFTNNGVFNFTDGLLQVKGGFQPRGGVNVLTIDGADSGDLPTLDLIGSGTTTNVTSLTVGNDHRGQLLLRQGRVLNLVNNTVGIGVSVGGEGTISVQSGAQLLTSGFLEVGGTLGGVAAGTGTLNIAGGTVDVGQLELFRGGTINLSSGTIAVNSLPTLDGQFNWTGGTLRFDAAFSLTSTNVPKLLGLDATLGPGQALTSAAGAAMTLQTPVVINGGTLNASLLINQSRLEVRSGSIGAVQNDGLIVGDGVIAGAVTNNATGAIRVDAGKSLFFSGTVAPNAGELNLQGGTLDFTSAVTNSAAGRINGRGTLNFDGGLTNAGKMQFSGGPTDIYGNVSFTGGAGGGEMINSGGANVVTFYGNVTHNGDEIRTSPTNTTVFFGNVTGAGPFNGTGAVRFEGTFMPGNSPAIVPFEGELQLGTDSRLVMELAGTTAGAQYDQLQVGGLLSLDGALEVTLLDGFAPHFGDTFDLLDFGGLIGHFDRIVLPALDTGLTWDSSALYSSGTITAVPEPAAWVLVVTALVMARLRWLDRKTRAQNRFRLCSAKFEHCSLAGAP